MASVGGLGVKLAVAIDDSQQKGSARQFERGSAQDIAYSLLAAKMLWTLIVDRIVSGMRVRRTISIMTFYFLTSFLRFHSQQSLRQGGHS
jgi:hypothetical protein